jgi:hypothetical protein
VLRKYGVQLSERLGTALGRAIAPLFATTSRGRHARTFHPRGDLARITVEAMPVGDEALARLGRALTGEGIARFSNAFWKVAAWPDALGCAIALHEPKQHLLFATIKRPWTTLLAPFSTHVENYLANDFFAVSPFRAPSLDRIWLRLHPEHAPPPGRHDWRERRARLQAAIASKAANLELAASPRPRGPFTAFARVTVLELYGADPPALVFDPFENGRGLEPVGFIHALRKGAYAGSWRGRRTPALPG